MKRAVSAPALALLCGLLLCAPVKAATSAPKPPPGAAAERLRSTLLQAQFDLTTASDQVVVMQTLYNESLSEQVQAIAPDANARARSALSDALRAAQTGDVARFAAARSDLWTALLHAGYLGARIALQNNTPVEAQRWLTLREFRRATRFTRPRADATLAVDALAAGQSDIKSALQALDADLLDTYQARLNSALDTVADARERGHSARLAESAALAQGYFVVLAPSFATHAGGGVALAAAKTAFLRLREHALADATPAATRVTDLEAIRAALSGFRAAPLSPAEQARRAGQMLRFLKLVPVEYSRAIRDGRVAIDLEIREAITFQEAAASAYADLRDALPVTAQADAAFAKLKRDLNSAAAYEPAVDPAVLESDVTQLMQVLESALPAEWLQQDGSADFDVIATALDQVEQAVLQGEYALAESARINAYAILESGPEAKIAAFAPQHKAPIEAWFWYGGEGGPGLAKLINEQAPAADIRAARKALDAELAAAQQALGGSNAPEAVATNAGIIVFREGLEAVLILASLMASFRAQGKTHLRKPMWLGTALAFAASIATWALMRGTIALFASYGEKLEAVVSLIAIGMLLLITNWFFHDVYWKGHMASQHKQKQSIIKSAAGQFVGLVLLGFSSVYREGFETALFLQSLVLAAGSGPVLIGSAIGLAGVALIGVAILALQARVPVMRMLVFTAVLIGIVLLVMVGNTMHVLQVLGWMPLTPIRWLQLPYWSGLWFGVYATVEGLLAQTIACVFTLGSYFLARRVKGEVVSVDSIKSVMNRTQTKPKL